MNPNPKSLINGIEQSGKELLSYVAQLSPDELNGGVQADDWSVHAVLAHLRDVEQHVFLTRIRRILGESEPPRVENFDQEQWHREHYSADEPLDRIIAELQAARGEELNLLRGAQDSDWARWAIHPEYGKISIEWLALHNYAHTLEHLHQLLVMREQALLRALNA